MSRLDPLVDALKKTEADEVRLVSGERIHLMRQGKRIDIGREPLQQASLHALAAEVMEQKDVAAIMQKEKRSAVVDKGGEKIEVIAQTLAGVLTLTVKRAGKGAPPAPEPQPAYASVPAMEAVKPAAPRRPRTGGHAIDDLLEEMMSKQASDLHLTSGSSPVLRVHGEMHFLKERPVLTSDAVMQLVQPIFSDKARVDFEEKHDADFAYEVPGLARFRVNVFLDRNGVGAVLRQIPIEIIPAEKLGLPQAVLDLCFLTKGLVVVTGPTGSGKSTTLAGMVDYINKQRQDHIITIEDPVEFVHKNIKCLVNQREIGQHTKSFKNALRAALREDPDIVLVGEMRDLETIAIAIETAETGHLVFGTLHTTTAISTVDRIIDQFPTDQQEQIRVMLSESLKGVIAQVLCKKIGGGRVAAMEILLGNSAVSSLIREGKTFQIPSIMQTSRGAGMVTMNDSLLALVQKKLVEPKEAWMKSVDKTGLTMMFKNAGIQFAGAAG